MANTPPDHAPEEELPGFLKDKDLFGLEKQELPAKLLQQEPEADQPVNSGIPVSDYQPVLGFCLLCVLSFGIYPFFWFYKHWVHLRDEQKEEVNTGMRAFFSVFYGYSLFKKFKVLALQKGYAKNPPVGLIFFLYLLSIFSVFLNGALLLLSFFSFILLIPVLKMMNFYYLRQQPHHRVNKGLAADEKIFLLVVWLVVLYLVFFAN